MAGMNRALPFVKLGIASIRFLYDAFVLETAETVVYT
jgi:hypothetical protein